MDTTRNDRRINWRILAWSAAALLLLTPWIAMQFTDEVAWEISDFVIFGVMLGTAGLALEFAARRSVDSAYKSGVGLAVLATFLLLWINGAVGIIGSDDNPANLMYVAIPAIALLGALVARFQARGMAIAMAAAGVAQVLAFVIALAVGWGFTGPITLVFAAMWFGSAQLFRRAAGEVKEG